MSEPADLFSIGSGAVTQAPPEPTQAGDPLVWTALGEAGGDKEGQRAVVSTVVNRAKRLGVAPADVVDDASQGYEAWKPEKRPDLQKRYPVGSPAYDAARANIADIASGKVDPPYAYDSFYSPTAQRALGRKAPDFDDGTGVDIGGNLFFGSKYEPGRAPDLLAIGSGSPALTASASGASPAAAASGASPAASAAEASGPATIKVVNGKVIDGATGRPVPEAQVGAMQTLMKANRIDADGKVAGRQLWMQRDPSDTIPAGDFYIDKTGSLKQSPIAGVPADPGASLGAGGYAGLGDVPNSLMRLMPFGEDSDIRNAMEGNRLLYDASHAGDRYAQAGRFIGQVAGSALPVAGGEAALGGLAARYAPGAVAPLLDFVAGNAGKATLNAAGQRVGGNLLLRTGSLASRGAGEGADAALSTSAASDRPLGQQVVTGALTGAALGPLAGVAGAAGRGVVNKLTGRVADGIPAAAQRAAYDQAINLPVPVKLTPGQLSLSPAQQMTENALMRGGSGDQAAMIMRDFAHEQQGALRGNVEAIQSNMAGGTPPTPGQGGAAVSSALNAKYDAAKAGVDAAYTAARQASDGAYLPAEERATMTQGLREALSDYDIGGVPRVKSILDSLDQSPTSSTFTPTDIFSARSKLTTLRASNDPVEARAAGTAVKALDGFVDDAVNRDLISGDPNVVNSWKTAIAQRREMGKLFEGNDLIQALTQRTVHGDGLALKVSPEDASNYIFGRSDLGFVGKKDLTRDLGRLRDTLGTDSPQWNALRSEAFSRIARAGEGAPEGGSAQFSGQKFFKAWNTAKTKDPQIVQTLFTPEERAQIDDFAEIAQRATTPVKGGDNASNSGVYIAAAAKRVLSKLGTMLGGAVGSMAGPEGAAVGAASGSAFDTFMRDVGAVVKAKRATSGAPPKASAGVDIPGPVNKLLARVTTPAAAITANDLMPAR